MKNACLNCQSAITTDGNCSSLKQFEFPPQEIETNTQHSVKTEDWSQSFHSLTYTAELLLNVVSLMIREPEEMQMAPPF